MAYLAPYKKVWIEQADGSQFDISEMVSSVKYSRDIEKENELSFTVEQKWIETLTDESPIVRGQIVFVQFGFLGGSRSNVFRCRVVDISHKYTTKVQMSVKCRDEGTVLKKTASTKVWQGVTTTEICKKVAERYGLEFVGDETTFVWDSFPQSQKDDWSFLQEVVKKEQGGNYWVYIDSGKLYLERRGADKASSLSFIYGQGDRIISFDVSIQEKSASTGAAASTEIAGFDPDKKEELTATVFPGAEKENIDLGEYKWVFSAEGGVLEKPTGGGILDNALEESTKFGERIISSQTSSAEIQNEANFTKKQATFKQMTATLKVVGEPTMTLNSVITMQGVLKVHTGNYLITAIDDEVTTGGYLTTLKLVKNGAAQPTSTQKQLSNTVLGEQVNKAKGWIENETKERVSVFNADGQKLDNPRTDYKVKDR